MKQFKSQYFLMRELVVLSLNIIYIKDTLQYCDRLQAKLNYLNFNLGSMGLLIISLQNRKRELNRRIKAMLEDLLNSKKPESNYVFNIDVDSASLTKKQLEKGYAFFTNVGDSTFALDIRSGALLPIVSPEENIPDRNLQSLEYTAQHEGAIYKYFEIDTTDPLKNELRY